MTKRFIYLAGPILGCTGKEANDWRKYVSDILKPHGIIGISPLRCEPLIGTTYNATYDIDPCFGTARAIAAKNLYDVQNCDLTLAYLPIPPAGKHQSFGTIGEIFWSHGLNKRVILVSDDPEINNHPVIDSVVNWKLTNLDQAIKVCIGVVGGYCDNGKNI